jgi:hypothetical protein
MIENGSYYRQYVISSLPHCLTSDADHSLHRRVAHVLERLHDICLVCPPQESGRSTVVYRGDPELGDRAVLVSLASSSQPNWVHHVDARPAQYFTRSHYLERVRPLRGVLLWGSRSSSIISGPECVCLPRCISCFVDTERTTASMCDGSRSQALHTQRRRCCHGRGILRRRHAHRPEPHHVPPRARDVLCRGPLVRYHHHSVGHRVLAVCLHPLSAVYSPVTDKVTWRSRRALSLVLCTTSSRHRPRSRGLCTMS